jgi:mannose-6-phosphate isomerase
MFLPAGELHSYLEGVGIEIMANSDNVLRGGLTPKHVAVPELLRTLTFHAGPIERLRPSPHRAAIFAMRRRARSSRSA